MGRCTYFVSSIVAALAAYAGAYAYHNELYGMPTWWWKARLPDSVEPLDVADTARLKQVLFSGEPWLIQCYSGLPYAGQWLPAPFRLNPVFVESLGTLRGLVRGGTLDCEQTLASNKTLASKFGLVRRTQPLLIYAGGGDRPRQIPSASATSAYGVTAWVKPKAEPRVVAARSQKALLQACAGRRACLISRLDADSVVLEQLARKFRTVVIVAIGAESSSSLSWGRGEEVGETLEEEEAKHFGQRTSLLRADPDAPRPTRKGAKPPPRMLQGYSGSEDLPSLSRFVEGALAAEATEGSVRVELPTLTSREKAKPPKKQKSSAPSANDNAERQAKRAKARAEKRKKEEAEAAAQAEARKTLTEAQQREAERRRREQMASEEAQASNLVEDIDDDDDDSGAGGEEEEEAEDYDADDDDDDGCARARHRVCPPMRGLRPPVPRDPPPPSFRLRCPLPEKS